MRQCSACVNLVHSSVYGRPRRCNARGGGVGMNKVASTTWISIVILIGILVAALVLYNY